MERTKNLKVREGLADALKRRVWDLSTVKPADLGQITVTCNINNLSKFTMREVTNALVGGFLVATENLGGFE